MGNDRHAYNKKKEKSADLVVGPVGPQYKDRVSMFDNVRDCISVAMQLLNIPQTTRDPEDCKIRELLVKQKPLVKQYRAPPPEQPRRRRDRSRDDVVRDLFQTARENPDLDYAIPKEGTYMWVDSLAIMRGARHREDTLRLIDYPLEPAVAAGIANSVRYATPNQAAQPQVDKVLLKDPRVYPTPALMKQLQLHHVLDSEQTELWSQTWADVKVA